MVRALLGSCLLVLFLSACSERTQRLPGQEDWLPYRAIAITQNNYKIVDAGGVTGCLLYDLDGDGISESFEARNPGILCQSWHPDGTRKPVWWHNLDRRYAFRDPCASLDGIWAVTDPGRRELVLTARTEDGLHWRIERRDIQSGELITFYEREGGKDLDGDGRWDGFMKVVDCIDAHIEGEVRRVFVIASSAGLDQQPRGVFALEVGTGEVLWEYFVGPQLRFHRIEVLDLDGDQNSEIIFVGGAVNNIHDRDYNGTRDDRSMLFVLNDDGSLAWSFTAFWGTGYCSFEVLDRYGDGKREVLLASGNQTEPSSWMWVLDHNGTPVDSVKIGKPVYDVAVAQKTTAAPRVLLSQVDGHLTTYSYEEAGLVPLQEKFHTRGLWLDLADMFSGPEEEIIAGYLENVWILDQDLDPLCYMQDDDIVFAMGRALVERDPNNARRLLLADQDDQDNIALRFERAERPVPVTGILVGATMLLAGALVWQRVRRPRLPRREIRLQFLRSLAVADHGKLGSLSSLRTMENDHNMVAVGDAEFASTAEEYTARARECLDISLPTLFEALESARLIGLDRLRIQQAKRALEKLRSLLQSIGPEESLVSISDRIGAEFADHLEEGQIAFERLFGEAQTEFRVDPRAMIERALRGHASDLEDMGVAVVLPKDDAPPCCVDEEQFGLVMDNLIENAIRAMRDSAKRRLEFEWTADSNSVALRVSDTGCGIDLAQWGAIMEPGVSTRDGGGRGLAASRDMLRVYGGGLFVRDSVVGEGTTMEIRCPRSRETQETKHGGQG